MQQDTTSIATEGIRSPKVPRTTKRPTQQSRRPAPQRMAGGIRTMEGLLREREQLRAENMALKLELTPGKFDVEMARQEREVGVDEVYCGVMAVARMLGFHIVEHKGGTYNVCRRRLLPAVLLSLGCTIYTSLLMVYLALTPVPFWYVVINLPCVFAYCFIVVACVETVLNRNNMAHYLTVMQSFTVRQSRWKTNISVLVYLCYTMVLAACTLLMVPSFQVTANIPLVCITSFVPAILDLYIESFVVILTASLEKLRKEVHARETWAAGGVRATFASWMEVAKAVTMHNKIFSLCAGLRLIQLMMKAMSLLYVVCSLQCWTGGCLSLLVITALPLGETTEILYRICRVGQHLATAGDRLLGAVTAAAYQVPPGSDEQLALAHLASRMESHLPRVLAWGSDR
ncbi:hypothetical protein O3P69_013794 [Scylla paramamosain]|uniref:Gustatory receptor n=1 Tax=Scylla paramamosain TaxID=85552 RepID=A0AAW0SRL3_SCYPA